MFNQHIATAAGAAIVQKAEDRLQALLAEQGVSHLSELLPSEAAAIHLKAVSDVASHFSPAELERLSHNVRSVSHPAFVPALERVSVAMTFSSDALTMARGVDAAVVLAAFGLPVAPFDMQEARILAEPSNDVDTVTAQFARWKTAYVGYNTSTAPIYVLLTDCVRTLVQKLPVHPELVEIKSLFEQSAASLPPDPGHSFVSGLAIFTRQPGDTISTIGLAGPKPSRGTIVLYAGWEVDGQAYGAPNAGYMPLPVKLLRAVVTDPTIAYAIGQGVTVPPSIH